MAKAVTLLFLLLIVSATLALADQSQLYSKIYLNPYYLGSTSNGVLYNYTLSVNPPDGLTSVYSATITFQAYLSPSVNFTLLVNNKSCNNANYYVSTTYATAGQGVASFDCSNVINKSGNYSVQLRMSKDTGAINGWLDLTYTNKRQGVVALSGTEYQVGDAVKTFLQLSEDNIPITNATCSVNIYYPNNTLWQTSQFLVFQNGSNGLYFWQGVAPNLTGVYMVDAVCQYFYGISWAFAQDSIIYPIPTTTTGSLVGTGLALNSYQDGAEMTSTASGGKTDSYFDFNTTGMNLTNTSSVLYWIGQSLGTQTPTLSVQVYNWTSATWKLLPNSIVLSGTGQSFATGQNDQLLTNAFALGGMVNATTNIIRIRVNSTGTATHSIFQNWLSIAFLNPSTQFLDNVRGGGEIHISNLGATQTGLIQSVLDYLTNTMYPYLTQIWNKLLGIEGQLNTTISITNQTLQNTNIILNISNLTKNDTTQIISLINSLNISVNNSGNIVIQNLTGLIETSLIQQLKFIGATEYVPNQQGKAVVQFLDKNLQPQNNLTPYVRIFYPNMSLFLNWSAMTNVGNGIYYKDFVAPSVYGVYIEDAYVVSGSQTYYVSHTFHISEPENTSILVGLNQTDLLVRNATTNLTNQIADLKANTTFNFNYTWGLLNLMDTNRNLTNAQMLSYLANLTLAISNTQTQLTNVNNSIFNNMNSINQSLSNQITTTSNTTQTLINNLNISSQARFDQLQSYLANLTTQVSNNQNMTQANFTQLQNLLTSVNLSLTTDITNLNVSLYNVRSDLLTQINQSYQYMIAMNQTINNNLALINTSLSSAIQTFRNEVSANFSTMFSTLSQLSTDLNGTRADLHSGLNNLTAQLTSTNASIQAKLDALNISIQAGFAEKDAHIQSAYNNITSQISNLSMTWDGNFSQVLSSLSNLSTQVSNNQNITQTNLSAINTYLTNLNTSIQQGFTGLNTSISNVQQNLSNQLSLVNASLTQEIIINRNDILLINQSLSNQVSSFENSTSANFNTTFALIAGLNGQNNVTQGLLANLSLQLNQTNWDIQSRIDLMNISISQRFDTLDSNVTEIISLLNNLSIGSNSSIQVILDTIANLSVQIDANQNITQSNLSTLLQECLALNQTLAQDCQNINQSLLQMNQTINNINVTVTWIAQNLNITTADLSLTVLAPAKCLLDTNWLAKATVKDRFGITLSYLDGIQCNMTTDLWGLSNMSYSFVDDTFRYIHACDPTNTTFNWSVDCGRI